MSRQAFFFKEALVNRRFLRASADAHGFVEETAASQFESGEGNAFISVSLIWSVLYR